VFQVEIARPILDLDGWRFEYRVDLKARRILVDVAIFRGK
jgi:hypothetical protein